MSESPDRQFKFHLNTADPIRGPYTANELVELPPHKMVTDKAGVIRTRHCPSTVGIVTQLHEPLDKHGNSYVATALCRNHACDFSFQLRV